MNKNLLAASAATLAMALTVASCGNASDPKLNQTGAMNVTTFEATRASRTTNITTKLGDTLDIAEGDVIGLMDDELVHAGGTPEDAVLSMLNRHFSGQEIVTVFGGPQKTEEDLEQLAERIKKDFAMLEVETHAGGPDLYDYLVTLE